MKKITLLLTILTLSLTTCTTQEPQTIINHLDSLNSVIASNDSVIINRDNYILQLNAAIINNQFADTVTVRLEGLTDSTLTIIDKAGENITITIQNGNKRVTSIFSEGERKSFFINTFDTSKTVGSYQLDNTDKPSFYYNPDNR